MIFCLGSTLDIDCESWSVLLMMVAMMVYGRCDKYVVFSRIVLLQGIDDG